MLRPEAVTATALWTMMAWAHEGATHSPILAAISVEPDPSHVALSGRTLSLTDARDHFNPRRRGILIGVHSRNHRRMPMPYRATLPVRSKRGAVHSQLKCPLTAAFCDVSKLMVPKNVRSNSDRRPN